MYIHVIVHNVMYNNILFPLYTVYLQWAVYSRNIVRTSNGLKLIADLLNNGHDSVVRAAATAVRNLAIDPRNRASLGEGQTNALFVHAHFSNVVMVHDTH